MPILDKHFVVHRDRVIQLLKTLQKSTRYLQQACNHSKVVYKDPTLMAHVPALKRCLETVLFRTKAMLAMNNLSKAFYLGSLKTRDLQGQVIPSQRSEEDDEDEQDDEGQQQGDADNMDQEEDQEEGDAAPVSGPDWQSEHEDRRGKKREGKQRSIYRAPQLELGSWCYLGSLLCSTMQMLVDEKQQRKRLVPASAVDNDDGDGEDEVDDLVSGCAAGFCLAGIILSFVVDNAIGARTRSGGGIRFIPAIISKQLSPVQPFRALLRIPFGFHHYATCGRHFIISS